MLIDWRRLYPDTKPKCNGCKYEYTKHEILCPGCKRDKVDNYKPAKVVEQMGSPFDYTTTIGYVLIPTEESISKTAFENIDALVAYLDRTKEVVGSFRGGFSVEPCEFVKVVE